MTLTLAPLPTAPSFPDVRFLDVPDRHVLAVDRSGEPSAPEGFLAAIQTLYPVAYTMKFAVKPRGITVKVGMPEGLFAVEGAGPEVFATGELDMSAWRWRAILEVGDGVGAEDFDAAIEAIRAKARGKKAKPLPPLIDEIRLEHFREGPSAEIVHVGPYDAETPTIARLHAAIREAGLRMHGYHHEIYLGDPRRTKPEKLRTIIRQAVE